MRREFEVLIREGLERSRRRWRHRANGACFHPVLQHNGDGFTCSVCLREVEVADAADAS